MAEPGPHDRRVQVASYLVAVVGGQVFGPQVYDHSVGRVVGPIIIQNFGLGALGEFKTELKMLTGVAVTLLVIAIASLAHAHARVRR